MATASALDGTGALQVAGATLTDHEVAGLASLYNLADGHAYHHYTEAFPYLPTRLADLWRECEDVPVPVMERSFLEAFAELVGCPSAKLTSRFKITPTASNSIDLVAALLAQRSATTALIEPTFDNLALLLRRRGVSLLPLPDADLTRASTNDCLGPLLDGISCGAVFLVSPNNPTGTSMTRPDLESLASHCRANDRLLVIDRCFRCYERAAFDDLSILVASGVSFVLIEDTGKVWPTHDLKASILLYSADVADELEALYNEFYLCHSRFALAVLRECLLDAGRNGLPMAIWSKVVWRRKLLRESLKRTPIRIAAGAEGSTLPVEWLDCSATGLTDLQIAAILRDRGITVLPGRQFFWASSGSPEHQSFIRVAMMKPSEVFRESVRRLAGTWSA